ncbi:solute carrier family 15 member 1-like [Babylonia areolata]|uniref:solute carrier family 15 member 1-like n=1 Tax=Babylonia areolata TaxID=304850 RepID=UPI003FD4430D
MSALAVLIMYLTGWLALGADEATAAFHLFNCMAYIAPVVGAAMADGAMGKYNAIEYKPLVIVCRSDGRDGRQSSGFSVETIVILCVVYAIGCVVLAGTSMPPKEMIGPVVGLFLISIGTGGMKPCVVSFGGDQLPRRQIRRRASFFSTFYLMINLGSVLSILITPLLRSDVHCVDDTCYPLAFGMPGFIMIAAACFCKSCRPWTGLQVIPSASRGLLRGAQITGAEPAMDDKKGSKDPEKGKKKGKSRGKKPAKGKPKSKGSKKEGEEKKGSKTDKKEAKGDSGKDKDSKGKDSGKNKAQSFVKDVDQVKKILWLFLPLPIFWALFNQQDASEKPLEDGQAGYTVMNTLDCQINVHGEPSPFFEGTVTPFGQTEFQRVSPGMKDVKVTCPTTGMQASAPANLTDRSAFRLVVVAQPGKINVLVVRLFFLHLLAWVDVAKLRVSSVRGQGNPTVMEVSLDNATLFNVFEPGSYEVSFPTVNNGTIPDKLDDGGWQKVGKSFNVGGGGVYTVALIDSHTNMDLNDVQIETFTDVKENSLSMLLLIPQYLLVTTGEVLFSISGLAYAYTQTC